MPAACGRFTTPAAGGGHLAALGTTRCLADAASIGCDIVRRRASAMRPPPTAVVS
jgi:hypothetical protein